MPRWLQVVITSSNLNQFLIPIPVLNSPCNSVFKTVPESWFWQIIMGVMKFSKFLSQRQKYLFETEKKVNFFITFQKINVNRKWLCPGESWGSEDFKTGIPFKNWPNMKPMPRKTRKGEKLNIHSQCQQGGKNLPIILT